MKVVYDLIIIGSGPAGINSGIYAARYKLKTLIIGEINGGMAASAHEICNLISYKTIKGFEFAMKLKEQIEHLGVKIISKKVVDIKKDKLFEVNVEDEIFFSKKIIFATGSEKEN